MPIDLAMRTTEAKRLPVYTRKKASVSQAHYESRGLTLAGGQTVRQSYSLEVSNVTEKITVTEAPPLIETVTTAQTQTLSTEVREIPVSRRNLQNVVLLGGGINSPDNALGAAGPSA